MREILFRAKTNNGEWVEGYYVKCRGHHYIFPVYDIDHGFDERYSEWVEVEAETVCQYTGLTDKNGRKIFKGDIVKVLYTDGEEDGRDVTEVKYSEKSASFSPWDWEYDCDGCDLYFHIKEIEVCGNIFDNPDLMGRGSVQ